MRRQNWYALLLPVYEVAVPAARVNGAGGDLFGRADVLGFFDLPAEHGDRLAWLR
jgi:hypothetical protein